MRLPSRDDVLVGGSFMLNLRGYLRHPVTLDQARATLRERLEHRDADFLALVRRAVFGYPASPYRRLLAHARCGPEDLEHLVRHEGIEGALTRLYRAGVFLTVDELKGRRPLKRGNTTLEIDPARLRNPLAVAQVPTGTGGSRGASARVATSFRYIRETSINRLLTLDVQGGTAWITALWMAPAAGALLQMLRYSGLGSRPVRWFSPLDPSSAEIQSRYRWAARALRWGGVLARAPLPAVETVPFSSPLPVVRWMSDVLRSGRVPHLVTSPSGAVLACRAALRAGISLRGAQITTNSEAMHQLDSE